MLRGCGTIGKMGARGAFGAKPEELPTLDQGTRALASLVKTDGDSVVVLNTASWPRTEVAVQAIATGANPSGTLPSSMASMIEIVEPSVLLVGMKRAEADERLVLRLWEVTGQATTAHVRLPLVPFQKARAASLVEEAQEPLAVRDSAVAVPIRTCGLATVLLE